MLAFKRKIQHLLPTGGFFKLLRRAAALCCIGGALREKIWENLRKIRKNLGEIKKNKFYNIAVVGFVYLSRQYWYVWWKNAQCCDKIFSREICNWRYIEFLLLLTFSENKIYHTSWLVFVIEAHFVQQVFF